MKYAFTDPIGSNAAKIIKASVIFLFMSYALKLVLKVE